MSGSKPIGRPSASSTRKGSGVRARAGMLAASAWSMPLAETATLAHDTSLVAQTTPPHISIVIPAYNEARRLPATLAGWRNFLNAQAYGWEILVVDDGSTDATSEIAARAGAGVIRLEPNLGKGGAVRAGVLAASGECIAYADADMNVAPAHLQEALRWLDTAAAPERSSESNRL